MAVGRTDEALHEHRVQTLPGRIPEPADADGVALEAVLRLRGVGAEPPVPEQPVEAEIKAVAQVWKGIASQGVPGV